MSPFRKHSNSKLLSFFLVHKLLPLGTYGWRNLFFDMPWQGGIRQQLGIRPRSRTPQPAHGDAAKQQPRLAEHGHLSVDAETARGSTGHVDLPTALGRSFVDNTLSAKQTHYLATAAVVSGATAMQGLSAAGSHGRFPGNMARDIRRQMLRKLKDHQKSKPYWFQLPVWNKDLGAIEEISYPMFLPHEILAEQVELVGLQKLAAKPELVVWSLVEAFAKESKCAAEQIVPMGLWGDGVPYKKKGSLELLVLNFLGDISGQRHLLIGVEHNSCCQCGSCAGRHTFDTVFEVLRWSFTMCFLGVWPHKRHDGQPWHPNSDSFREAKKGQSLQGVGGLLQLRADWKWLNGMLSLPHWGGSSICPWCAANNSNVHWKVTGPAAGWREARVSQEEFFASLQQKGVSPNPLFSSPGFSLLHLHLDWLHCVDLGCAADIIGCTLWEALDFQDGASRKARARNLWSKLKEYYSTNIVASGLDNLTTEMLFPSGFSSPKLKAKGAECRGVLPFSLQVAQDIAGQTGTTHWARIELCNKALFDLTRSISKVPYNWVEAATHCRTFAMAWESLATEEETVWALKPKLHMLQEMVEIHSARLGSPEAYWTYRDEDFGGVCAKLARSRGGCSSAAGLGLRLLHRHLLLALGKHVSVIRLGTTASGLRS